MRYGLVTAGIAALAVAATAGVIAVGQPTDQAGAPLREAPIRIVPAASSAAGPEALAGTGTVPSPPPATGSKSDPAREVPTTPTSAAPAETRAPAAPAAPTAPSAALASPSAAPAAPTRVDPAPAQPVDPRNSGKHKGAGKGNGAGGAP